MSEKNKAFNIPGFHESIKRDFEAGLITLEKAAIEFYKGNWTSFIDIEYTKKQLGI
ncbi:hypothetical protein QMI71_004408 [Salmonella enterica]|nr:hypothetical protein [Salmonella enterica]